MKRPRRKRYRCPACFTEALVHDDQYLAELNEVHRCMREGKAQGFEPVARLRRSQKKSGSDV